MNTEVHLVRHHEKRKFLLLQHLQRLLKNQPNRRKVTNQTQTSMMMTLKRTKEPEAQNLRSQRKRKMKAMTNGERTTGVRTSQELMQKVAQVPKYRKKRERMRSCDEIYSLELVVATMRQMTYRPLERDLVVKLKTNLIKYCQQVKRTGGYWRQLG